MATEYSIKTVIKASDQITSPMRQIMASTASAARRATEKISEGAKEATSHVFSLGEGVGLVSGALGALAGAVSIGGLAEMVKSYAGCARYRSHQQLQLGLLMFPKQGCRGTNLHPSLLTGRQTSRIVR